MSLSPSSGTTPYEIVSRNAGQVIFHKENDDIGSVA